MMTWKDIVDLLEDDILESRITIPDHKIVRIATDSRLIHYPEETLFFAISGEQHDGHSFIKSLNERGLSFAIIEKEGSGLSELKLDYLQVKSSVIALQKIAKKHREQFDIPIIAITGSNGKTTTKEWLSSSLSKKYSVIKSPKSYNSQIGVPLSLWNINESHEVGVFETGISEKGEMEKLREMVQPTIGIFTSIGPAHDEGFTSRKEKIKEKSHLFKDCRQVICRKDHSEIYKQLKKVYPGTLISWSIEDPSADFIYHRKGNHFLIDSGKGQIEITIPFSFDIWIENALHVITTCLLMECSEKQIQKAVNELKPVSMRLEIKQGINQSFLIDDAYNNDLQGLSVALDFLQQQQQQNRKTVILSDMLQTGMEPSELYEKVSKLISVHKVDRLIGIGPNLDKYSEKFNLPVINFANTADFLQNPPSFREEMILVKGARKFELEKIVGYLEAKSHRTVLEVNFESIIYNLRQFNAFISPETKLMVMVKALAYGGGSLEIANLLQFHKVDYLGVAYTDEAINLRKNGIHLPIMVMSPDFAEPELLVKYKLEPEVYTFQGLKKLVELSEPPAIHLKIETGMNRLGFTEDQIPELCDFLKNHPELRIAGVFTHFASADDPHEDNYTRQQATIFKESYQKIIGHLDYKPLAHAVNSAGIARWKDYHFDMVRLGIGLYGYDSTESVKLRPISTLKTSVSQIKNVKKGGTIGYGRMGKADTDKQIAIVPIGYADGYLRVFSRGVGKMNVKGKLVPTIGNVCMDMTMLDVTGLNVKEGDEVIVFGENPTIQMVAEWANTIPYEVLTNVSQRVKRIYISE